MYGINLLGVNLGDSCKNTQDPEKQLQEIMQGASEDLNSFKEVRDAIKALQEQSDPSAALQEYLNGSAAIQQISSAVDSVISNKNYITEESLKNYAKTEDIPEAYNDTEIKTLIEGKANLEHTHQEYAKISDIPTTLPASDVPSWAKAETKPSYTAEEVGALSSDTVIPAAQVQSDWEAAEGMGAILNKPEILSKTEIENLYNVLASRLEVLENKQPTTEQLSYKGYFAIVPGEDTKTWKANLAGELNFIELPEGGSQIDSGNESGMIAVAYNKWIPRFDAFDEGANSWQENETSLSAAFADGKEINGEKYILWYNTGATVDENTIFKVILP